MPVDDHGFKADLIIDPVSVYNRMNVGQMYETFLNRAGEFIARRVRGNGFKTVNDKYKYIISFLRDVRPTFADFIQKLLVTREDIEEFVAEVERDGIHMIIPPMCDSITEQMVLRVAEKYNIDETPVNYNVHKSDGSIERVRTTSPVSIGSKYIILIGKFPANQINAVQFGYINQFGTPHKNEETIAKQKHLRKCTPIRMGEDEVCLTSMSVGVKTLTRLLGLHATSPAMTHELQYELLTQEMPSAFPRLNRRTGEIIDNNVIIAVFKNMMGVIGYDIAETAHPELD